MPRPMFPTHANLTHLSRDDAERALSALRVLVKHDLASVYTGAGSHDTRWYVWSELQRRRFPLAEWAAQWLASQESETLETAHFAVGQVVSWPQGRCTLRIDGSGCQPTPPYTRWYGGVILTGDNAGSYALSVPEEQLAATEDGPDGPEAA